jgi:hypothetical protein
VHDQPVLVWPDQHELLFAAADKLCNGDFLRLLKRRGQ